MEYLCICLCHLWFLSSVIIIFCIQFFCPLDRFIPRYLIFFVEMVNGIDSLISLSGFSLLVYINASDFCVLILYPATLLNSLMSSISELAVDNTIFRVFYVQYHVSWKIWELYFFFSNLDSFFFLFVSPLIAVARTSGIILNNNGESKHPYLLPDLRGDAFSFSPLRAMFAVGLSYMAFTMLR